MKNNKAQITSGRVKKILQLLQSIAPQYERHRVFRDGVELIAAAMSDLAEPALRDEREERFQNVEKNYNQEDGRLFADVMVELSIELAENPSDVLGTVFAEVGIPNSRLGQFFTPFTMAMGASRFLVGDGRTLRERIREKGHLRFADPCVGSGVLPIALAKQMSDLHIDYTQCLHVEAMDIDERAVLMAYVQLSFLGIPAVVVHGNAATGETWGTWKTFAHVRDNWGRRLARMDCIEEKDCSMTARSTQVTGHKIHTHHPFGNPPSSVQHRLCLNDSNVHQRTRNYPDEQ